MTNYQRIYQSRTDQNLQSADDFGQQVQRMQVSQRYDPNYRALTPSQLRRLQREQDRMLRDEQARIDQAEINMPRRSQQKGMFMPCTAPQRPEVDVPAFAASALESQPSPVQQEALPSVSPGSFMGNTKRLVDPWLDLPPAVRQETVNPAVSNRIYRNEDSRRSQAAQQQLPAEAGQPAAFQSKAQLPKRYYHATQILEQNFLAYQSNEPATSTSETPCKQFAESGFQTEEMMSYELQGKDGNAVASLMQQYNATREDPMQRRFSVHMSEAKFDTQLYELQESIKNSVILSDKISPSKALQIDQFNRRITRESLSNGDSQLRRSLKEQAEDIHTYLNSQVDRKADQLQQVYTDVHSAASVVEKAKKLSERGEQLLGNDFAAPDEPQAEQKFYLSRPANVSQLNDQTAMDYQSFAEDVRVSVERNQIDALTSYEIEMIYRLRNEQRPTYDQKMKDLRGKYGSATEK